MDKLLQLLSLQSLKGSRTQVTLIVIALVNLLNQVGILHLSPTDLDTVNKFLTIIGTYFFAEKVQTLASK